MQDAELGFKLFACHDVSGADLEMELGDFKEKCKTDGGFPTNAADLVVYYNGKIFKDDAKSLKAQGAKNSNFKVANTGIIEQKMVANAVRSMGYPITETVMEDYAEQVRAQFSNVVLLIGWRASVYKCTARAQPAASTRSKR